MAERLVITEIGHRGDGVAEGADGPIYVPYTLPTEAVEVEQVAGHPDRRHLVRVDQPSAARIAPICPHFGTCGGCALQHWATSDYREWKRSLVVTALAQAGIDAAVGDLVDGHGDGRRRAVFHARRSQKDILEVGFMQAGSHRIVAIDRCPIFAPGLADAIPVAWTIAETIGAKAKPLDIHVTAADAGLDVDVRGSGPLRPATMSQLARDAEHHGIARLTRHGELVVRRSAPSIRIGRATVALPPGAFLQATAAGEAALASLVCAGAVKAKTVVDLFCGVGPFALRLAERAKVIAADNDEGAIAALREAAKTPGLKPITAERRDLFRRPFLAHELKGVDVVVFDPPRQGAEAQARALAASAVPQVIAVSCNPATFARDATILRDAGYRLTEITPVDQFRYSAHVEIVARLQR